jgi:putative NIF3 family GTP cyclohydrolase 1 type 2
LSEPLAVPFLARELKLQLPDCRLRAVDLGRKVQRVAIACGSGASLLEAAMKQNCDLFLTGEATYHQCLEAQANQVSMLLIGHFASERFAMVELADRIGKHFAALEARSCQTDRDPVQAISD